MMRYEVNWFRLWLANMGCLLPFALAYADVTGSYPYQFLLQTVIMASMGVYSKYSTTRAEMRQLNDPDARAKLLRLRRLSLANQRKRSDVTDAILLYVGLVSLALGAVLVARHLHWIAAPALLKAIIYAFGSPVIAVGSLRVEIRVLNDSDVNHELDREIACDDTALLQQKQEAEPQTLTCLAPAALEAVTPDPS